ncbi:cysteine hydrolase [Sphingobium sp. Sx8-8]|uniref:cysteine hydrolase n=1 Tax=Sphingobium sp. Sx8-8 TaxID=2933617 RepID=UPI001F570A1F|nr:cysteine hydrolase [Sphingobium sp. Sx8-8]
MGVKGLDQGQRAALLIMECQEGIANSAVRSSPLADMVAKRGIIPQIAALADWFREQGLPVVHCHVAMPARDSGIAWPINCLLAAYVWKAGEFWDGSALVQSHRDLPVKPGDISMVRYSGVSPFTATQLDGVLRNLGVETVVLAGVSTNVGLPGAATEAVGLGYFAVLAEDCSAGATAEVHEMQITANLPMIATISSAAAIRAAIAG